MRNVDGEVDILFQGGNIAVGGGTGTLKSGEQVSFAQFQPLVEVQPIGGEVKGLERSGQLVRMIFTKAESIDVVIGQLERTRERLKVTAKQETVSPEPMSIAEKYDASTYKQEPTDG